MRVWWLTSILMLKNQTFGAPRLPKYLLEARRQCQGAARGSQEWPGGAKQESQSLPGDVFGLPGGCLGRFWDLPGRRPGTILEQDSMILQQIFLILFFWCCVANFNAFLFFPTLRIYCNLQLILHVFRFGPFQKDISKLSWKIMDIAPTNREISTMLNKMLNELQNNHPTANFEAFKRQKKQNAANNHDFSLDFECQMARRIGARGFDTLTAHRADPTRKG